MYGPGLHEFDFSVIKNTHIPSISEIFNVPFWVEAFNFLNRSNFAPPVDNKTIYNPSVLGFGTFLSYPASSFAAAGAIDSTATTLTQLPFALKGNLVSKSRLALRCDARRIFLRRIWRCATLLLR